MTGRELRNSTFSQDRGQQKRAVEGAGMRGIQKGPLHMCPSRLCHPNWDLPWAEDRDHQGTTSFPKISHLCAHLHICSKSCLFCIRQRAVLGLRVWKGRVTERLMRGRASNGITSMQDALREPCAA